MTWNGYVCAAPTVSSCVAPMVWDGYACVTPTSTACVAPMVWNGTACVAPTVSSCVAPMVWDGYACVTPTSTTCVAPMVWNGTTCAAPTAGSCVAPMTWDGYTCVAPTVSSCVAPMVWDGYACVTPTSTTCVAPMVWDGVACVVQTTTCAEPTVWNGLAWVAPTTTCIAPQEWNGTTCVDPASSCVAPMVWNGTACAAPTVITCVAPEVLNAEGTACVAPSGSACTPPQVPDANGVCVTAQGMKAGNQLTYATAPPPSAGMMYDAFGMQVKIPSAGYRNIGYAHSLTGGASTEITLNHAGSVATAPSGAVVSFRAPSFDGTALTSANQFNIGVGTATLMDFGTDPVTGMSWGRWQGGQMSLTSLSTGQVTPIANGAGSTHWFASPTQTQAITLPLTGVIPYTLAGKTTPTDASGALGTLNSATFTANFTNATVDIGLNLSMPAVTKPTASPSITINASAFGIPIMPGANFTTTNPTISCPACTGVTTGTIAGQFSGPGGPGVGVGYGFKNGARVINGAAVFRK